MKFGVSAAGVTPREPQADDWRDGRAELIRSLIEWKLQRLGIGLGVCTGSTIWRARSLRGWHAVRVATQVPFSAKT